MQCCLPVTVICDLDSTEEPPPVADFTVKQAFAKHDTCERAEQNMTRLPAHL